MPDPTLQVRRWFERRPVILAAAAAGLAAGAVAGRFSDQMRALLEQRRGLGRLLDAQEDDRRRHAETLHEELAQVLAAVLINLRLLRRRGVEGESLDELHDQVVGVLDEVRGLATELRPSSLAQLGLVPALEALDGVSVVAGALPEPVPEPARTGVYRFVEHVAAAARSGAWVRVSSADARLDLVLDADLPGPEAVSAARARIALLAGSLSAEPLPAGRTRLRVRLPLQAARAPTGSVARTTVRPTVESSSS